MDIRVRTSSHMVYDLGSFCNFYAVDSGEGFVLVATRQVILTQGNASITMLDEHVFAYFVTDPHPIQRDEGMSTKTAKQKAEEAIDRIWHALERGKKSCDVSDLGSKGTKEVRELCGIVDQPYSDVGDGKESTVKTDPKQFVVQLADYNNPEKELRKLGDLKDRTVRKVTVNDGLVCLHTGE